VSEALLLVLVCCLACRQMQEEELLRSLSSTTSSCRGVAPRDCMRFCATVSALCSQGKGQAELWHEGLNSACST